MVTALPLGLEVSLTVDGSRPISADLVARVALLCDRVERHEEPLPLVLRVAGTPGERWLDGVTVGLVSKWERIVRRLERVPAATVAVADGDCGGTALDVLLAADFRVATPSTRLAVPVTGGSAWPGMSVYRLTNQSAAAVRGAAMFGIPLSALEALALHLVDRVTADVAGALAGFAATIRDLGGAELAMVRQLMFDAPSTEFEVALGAHLAACERVLRRVADRERP